MINNRQSTLLTISIAIIIASALATPQAKAVVFNDPIHTSTTLTSQFQTVIQYGKQLAGMAKDAQHYMATYNHYQQELIKLQRMVSTLSLGKQHALEKVAEDYMVVETCGGSSLSLASLFKVLVPNPKGDLLQQQRDNCSRIQMSRNLKFNETVEFLTETRKATQEEIAALASRSDTDKTNGNLDRNTNDQLASANRLTALNDNYQSQMRYYDDLINTLEERQKLLAYGALRGTEKGPLGTLVKTATLQAALKVGK